MSCVYCYSIPRACSVNIIEIERQQEGLKKVTFASCRFTVIHHFNLCTKPASKLSVPQPRFQTHNWESANCFYFYNRFFSPLLLTVKVC